MALLEVLKYPAAILSKKTLPVDKIDDEIRKNVQDMFETLKAEGALGLAANQVGIDKRIFVMDDSPDMTNPQCYINPEVVEEKGSIEFAEGCLSFPGIYPKITRPNYVKIKALDLNGKEVFKEAEGYNAHCLLHEIDHLNGITFLDYLSPLKRKMAEKKFMKLQRISL